LLTYISYSMILNGIPADKNNILRSYGAIMNIHGADLVIKLLALLESERTRENEGICSATFDTVRTLIGLF